MLKRNLISPIWVVLYTTIVITSLALTNKIIEWHGIIISACLISFPLIYLFGDMVAETYGYKESQKLIWYTTFSCLIFSIICQIAINIPSAKFYNNAVAYQQVLGQDLKFTFVACIAIIVGSLVNAYTITKWKLLVKGRYFWLRSIGATSLGELVNTLIAFPLAFSGDMPTNDIIKMMFFAYLFKMLYAVIFAYPAAIIVSIQKKNGLDNYDTDFKFNPFSN